MNEYSMMTQELQDLAALSMEHGQIPSGLYDQYHVLRGLRDVNGKGVLAGLTQISNVCAVRVCWQDLRIFPPSPLPKKLMERWFPAMENCVTEVTISTTL